MNVPVAPETQPQYVEPEYRRPALIITPTASPGFSQVLKWRARLLLGAGATENHYCMDALKLRL